MMPKTTRQIARRPDPPAPTRRKALPPPPAPAPSGPLSRRGDRSARLHTALTVALLLILLALLVCALAPRSAWAHGWYDPACCSDRDCAPLPAGSVTATATGWRIDLPEGAHPFLRTTEPFTVPYAPASAFDPRIERSRDHRFHLCASETMLLCLYVPGAGA